MSKSYELEDRSSTASSTPPAKYKNHNGHVNAGYEEIVATDIDGTTTIDVSHDDPSAVEAQDKKEEDNKVKSKHRQSQAHPSATSVNENTISSQNHLDSFQAEDGDQTNDKNAGKDSLEDSENSNMVIVVQQKLGSIWSDHGDAMVAVVACMCLTFYACYLGYAMWYEFGSESSVRLLWMSLLGVAIVIISMVKDRYGEQIYDKALAPITRFVGKHFRFFKIFFLIAVVAGLVVFLIVEVALELPRNLVSFSGYIAFLILFFVFSYNPSKVRWRPVLWGLGIQFCFALMVLRTSWGYAAFKWIGDRIQEYMEYTDVGSEFVFGEDFADHMFAFQVLPVVIFFSATISVLYYLGIMQIIISKLAWLMSRTLGTTAAESTNAAGNIFIGQTEAPLLIRPLINSMSDSEIHAVMVGGFATIAGSVMATYMLYGVPANHLVTASVMAAPAALAMSKLSYPEEDLERLKHAGEAKMEVPPYSNVIEAAAAGAIAAVPLVANIAANIIVFMAGITFLNTTLTWMGHRVGLWAPEYQELTFEVICSYALWPFAFMMGVSTEDCRKVAELIGIKTFINEFVAFTELGNIIDNSEIFNEYVDQDGSWEKLNNGDIYLIDTNQTLVGGVLQDRSIVISTYALCGFGNVASIGTVMGALGTMAPSKQSAISSMAVRAMVTGTVVCFMNACIAGLMYEGDL